MAGEGEEARVQGTASLHPGGAGGSEVPRSRCPGSLHSQPVGSALTECL